MRKREMLAPTPVVTGALKRIMLIESVGETEPHDIVPVKQCQGTAMGADESAATKVKWAQKAGYRVVTRNIPDTFAPYNAVIRVSDRGTEDRQRDYLAEFNR